MIIAGIGSRETPVDVLQTLSAAGAALASRGHHGRSGGARGADGAFEQGFTTAPYLLRSYHANEGDRPDCLALAARFHPAWDRCSPYARLLHARNGLILLGDDLASPVDAILCWTPQGRITGGTGQALRIAADKDYRIPVFNLAVDPVDALWQWMWSQYNE